LPAGRSVLGKTVPEVLSTARGRRPRVVLKIEGKLLYKYGKLLYKKYLCWFFTEAVSHRARAFDVSVKQTVLLTEVFKRRDSVFADFRTEQWRIYISWRFRVTKSFWNNRNVGKLGAVCTGVRMGKSGPLERNELANQIQGFRIPDRWDAWEKNKKWYFKVWHWTTYHALKLLRSKVTEWNYLFLHSHSFTSSETLAKRSHFRSCQILSAPYQPCFLNVHAKREKKNPWLPILKANLPFLKAFGYHEFSHCACPLLPVLRKLSVQYVKLLCQIILYLFRNWEEPLLAFARAQSMFASRTDSSLWVHDWYAVVDVLRFALLQT